MLVLTHGDQEQHGLGLPLNWCRVPVPASKKLSLPSARGAASPPATFATSPPSVTVNVTPSHLMRPLAAAGFLWLATGENALQLSSVEQESMMPRRRPGQGEAASRRGSQRGLQGDAATQGIGKSRWIWMELYTRPYSKNTRSYTLRVDLMRRKSYLDGISSIW